MARTKQRECDLKDAAGRCAAPNVAVAREQTRRLLAAAIKLLGSKSPTKCVVKLESARAEAKAADAVTGSKLEQRNSYIRAAFHAGQAHACAIVGGMGPRQLTKSGTKRQAKIEARHEIESMERSELGERRARKAKSR